MSFALDYRDLEFVKREIDTYRKRHKSRQTMRQRERQREGARPLSTQRRR